MARDKVMRRKRRRVYRDGYQPLLTARQKEAKVTPRLQQDVDDVTAVLQVS